MDLNESLWLPVLAGVLSTILATGLLSLVAGYRPGRRPEPRRQAVRTDDHSVTFQGDRFLGDKVQGDKIVNPHHEQHHHHYGPTGNTTALDTAAATRVVPVRWGRLP